VQPLIGALQDSPSTFTTHRLITFLGAIGLVAKKAIPFILEAAERDNDKDIDKASEDAIRKIEGGDK
jgi:hypothetical protein